VKANMGKQRTIVTIGELSEHLQVAARCLAVPADWRSA
jgi:hypothetical protein